MDELDVDRVAEVSLSDPVLVEGLPGVGHVGKLAAEHLLEELDAESTLVRRIHSRELPPQVGVADGVATLSGLAIHAIAPETGRDLLVLTGDHQAQTNRGHYLLTDAVLDVAEAFGVEMIYALGGVPTGELIDEYAVLGAVTDESLKPELESVGVEFRDDEPAGGIVGVSGLLLGLGARRELPAACLMGETSGYLVDPKSARSVLGVLEDRLDVALTYESLDERADEMETVIARIQEMERQGSVEPATDEDLRYFG